MSKFIKYIFISTILLYVCSLAKPPVASAVTPQGTEICNTAEISYTTGNGLGQYSVTSKKVCTEVGSPLLPVLLLSKSGPEEVLPGEEITYEIAYKNDGAVTPANATGVVLTDKLPATVAFVGASSDGIYVGDGTVTWSIGSLPFNQSGIVKLTVKVNENLDVAPHLSVGKTIENRASITCLEGSTFNASHIANVINVSLSLEKIAPTEVFATETINYEIKYENDGNVSLENVTITDEIPEYTTFVSATGDFTEKDGVITWMISQLAAGASGSFSLKVQPMEFIPDNLDNTKLIKLPDGTIVTNEAEIKAQNQTYDKSTTTTTVKNPNLYQEKRFGNDFDGSKVYEDGDIIPYVILYRNESQTTTYKNVRIEDPIPAYTKFKNAPGAFPSPQIGLVEKVTWLVDDLDPGEEGTLTLELEIDLSGVPAGNEVKIENVAKIISDEPQVDREFYGPEVSAFRGQASIPLIKIEKSVDKNAASGGDILTYTIKYKNVGEEKATVVVIEDTLPEHVDYISASDTGVFNGDTKTVTWQLGELFPSEVQASISLQVRVMATACGVTIENQALAKWKEGFLPEYSNKVQTVTPDCQISLVADPKVILGNGRSISHLTAQVLVKGGNPVPDGTKVTFTTDKGSLRNPDGTPTRTLTETTLNGMAKTDLYSEIVSNFKVTATPKASAEVAGEASDTVDFVAGALAGVVTDHTLGQNVSGVLVRAANNPLTGETETTTDSNGEWSVLITDPLKYELAYVTTDFRGAQLELSDDVSITPSSGQIYYPENIISGAVLEYDSGRRVPNVTLKLINASTNAIVRANIVTDTQGRYEIKKLNQGRYRVEVTQSPQGLAPDGPLTVNNDRSGQVIINANIVLGQQREIIKSVDKKVAFPGDVLTYNITYQNNGENFKNLRLIDSIPYKTEYVSSEPEAVLSENNVVWAFDIDEYNFVEVQFTVRVKSNAKTGDTIENQAYISPLDNPADALYSNVVQTDINQLSFAKSADKNFVSPGGEVTYTLTVGNPSEIAADGVSIVDNLPSGVSVINISDGGKQVGEQVIWNLNPLEAKAEKSVTITLRVNEDTNVCDITNTAVVMINDVTQGESETVLISIGGLYYAQSADKDKVRPGDIVTFTLEYANTGCTTMHDVVIRADIPDQLEWVEGGNYISGQRTVEFYIGDLPPPVPAAPQRKSVGGPKPSHVDKVTYKVRVKGCEPGKTFSTEIVNRSWVDSKDISQPITLSLELELVIEVNTVASVKVTTAGSIIEYTITFENTGGIEAHTTIRTRIPENTTFVSVSGNGRYSEETGEVVWDLGVLECKDTGILTLVVRVDDCVPPGTIIENITFLTDDRPSETTVTTNVTIVEAKLDIQKTAEPASVVPGEEITYTIAYANTNDVEAKHVFIADTVPENTVFVSVSDDGKLDEDLVTWSIGTLAPGDAGSVEMVVKVIKEPTQSLLDSGIIFNTATIDVSPRNEEGNILCSFSGVSSTVETPVNIQEGLQVKKEADPKKARPGDIITYTITCSNTGNLDYTDVKIEDTLPPELEFVDFEGQTGEYNKDGKIIFDVGKLASGESQEFKYEAQIKTDIDNTKIHQIKNVVVLTSKQGDLPPVEEIVQAIPNFLKVTLAGNKRVMEIGDPVAFVIDVENTSVDTTIEEVELVNTLPPGIKYIENTSVIDGEKVSDPKIEVVKDPKTGEPRQKLTWEVGTLEPKGKTRLVFRATLEPTISDRTFGIENTAKAYGKIKDVDGVVLQQGEVESAEAKWPIRIRRGMFDKLGQIIGKVFIDDNCNGFQENGEKGFPSARLYMENGTVVTTDEVGKYHVTQVEPGYHVIKIDKNSIEGHEVNVHSTRYAAPLGTSSRNLGQFVNVPENGTTKIDFALKALPAEKQVEKKPVPTIKPDIEQPQRVIVETPIPSVDIEPPALAAEPQRQVPEIIPDIEQPLLGDPRGFNISLGPSPVRVTLPMVANPIAAPDVSIEFKPDRIPAGDPKIIVTSPSTLLNVIAKHPDGRTIALKKKPDGSWQEEFTVPFDTPEGPYPFTFWITDETGREWYFRKTVMVDNSIPNVYAEFVPRRTKRGTKTLLKVTLLIDAKDAKSVYVRFRDLKKVLYLKREKRFHWSTSYTIPQNMQPGWHSAEVFVIPKEDPRFKQRARVAYKVE